MTAFSIALVVGYFIPRVEGVLFFLALSIAVSRIVLGMHFLSDVLAGVVMALPLGALPSPHLPRSASFSAPRGIACLPASSPNACSAKEFETHEMMHHTAPV